MGRASVKVEGGKMVNVKVEDSEISVTGDFFIEPAEAREQIESVLRDHGSLSEKELVRKINQIDARLIGFSAKHVAEAFQKAKGDQK